jgi:hypothetical protein
VEGGRGKRLHGAKVARLTLPTWRVLWSWMEAGSCVEGYAPTAEPQLERSGGETAP